MKHKYLYKPKPSNFWYVLTTSVRACVSYIISHNRKPRTKRNKNNKREKKKEKENARHEKFYENSAEQQIATQEYCHGEKAK